MKKYLSLFFLVLLGSASFYAVSSYQTKSKPNVLLIVVDTLAAKQLPTFNDKIEIESNFIKKLSDNGLTFQNAYAASSWTKPSISSILSGLYPKDHGVKILASSLPNEIKTIPSYLREHDYQNFAIVSHTILNKKSNILKDFDFVKNVNPTNPHAAIVANTVTNNVIEKLSNRDKSKPFFMFAHYFDPHYNYQDHKSVNYTDPNYKGKVTSGLHIIKLRDLKFNDEDKKQLVNLYHEEITYTDRALNRLYDYLKNSKLLGSTIIVFVADHGEELLERGWIGHTKTLYNEIIRVPLIISAKDLKPKEITASVSQIDILPTILELLNIKSDTANASLQGVNLTKAINKNRMLFSEVTFTSSRHVKDANKIAVINGLNKLILNREDNSYEFYNLKDDIDEKNNLINDSKYQEIIATLKKEISSFENKVSNKNENENKGENKNKNNKDIKFNKKELKDLESLGYL
ncbi:MAG: sulfatase [Bdellovibrionota bacterium]